MNANVGVPRKSPSSIHYNPVKHGPVAKVCDWPYSTFHRYVLLGRYPRDWAGSVLARTQGGYGELDE